MKNLFLSPCRLALLLLTAFFASTTTFADTLIGSTLSATLSGTPGLDVVTPFVPSAVVGPGTEFTGSFYDTFHYTYSIAVDVYDSGFLINITSPDSTANISSIPLYELTLSGLPAFVNGFALSSYSCDQAKNSTCFVFPPSLLIPTNTVVNSTLTLDISYLANGQSFDFTATSPAAVTPEPSSLLLFGTGITGAASLLRRRLTSSLRSTFERRSDRPGVCPSKPEPELDSEYGRFRSLRLSAEARMQACLPKLKLRWRREESQLLCRWMIAT
jgi:hypothetical protein